VLEFKYLGAQDADHGSFLVECGAGTYMRSLARDLALALGTVGHISELRRLAAGVFDEEDAIPLDEIENSSITQAREQMLLPVEAALDDIPALALTTAEAQRLRLGQSVKFLSRQDRHRLDEIGASEADEAVLTMADGKPVALVRIEGPEIKPLRVLNL